MVDVLDIDAAAGLLAIYTSPGAGSDDAPLYNPTANLARVKLHSSLDYPKIINVVTGSITLPAVTNDTRRLVTHTLFAHGQSGFPWVFGKVSLGGVWVSLAGTAIVQADSDNHFPRMLAIGADATNVLAHENGMCGHFNTMASLTLSYQVYVTDVLL